MLNLRYYISNKANPLRSNSIRASTLLYLSLSIIGLKDPSIRKIYYVRDLP